MPLKDKPDEKPSIDKTNDNHNKHRKIETDADLCQYMWNNGYTAQYIRPGFKLYSI